MHSKWLRNRLWAVVSTTCAWAQQPGSCANLANFKAENVEITKAAAIAAGTTEAIPWNQTRSAPLPAYCRVEGVMNRRTGVDGEEFGITFALAMPGKWNGDFLMQGGAGSNGVVMPPLGLNAERHHLRRSRDAHRAFQSRDRPVDSDCLQSLAPRPVFSDLRLPT
jgi:hypothetical protein